MYFLGYIYSMFSFFFFYVFGYWNMNWINYFIFKWLKNKVVIVLFKSFIISVWKLFSFLVIWEIRFLNFFKDLKCIYWLIKYVILDIYYFFISYKWYKKDNNWYNRRYKKML